MKIPYLNTTNIYSYPVSPSISIPMLIGHTSQPTIIDMPYVKSNHPDMKVTIIPIVINLPDKT